MRRLTEAQRNALRIVSNPDGGWAGSRWYPGSCLGGAAVTRPLNKLGFIKPDKDFGAGLNWRITDLGRSALAQSEEEK